MKVSTIHKIYSMVFDCTLTLRCVPLWFCCKVEPNLFQFLSKRVVFYIYFVCSIVQKSLKMPFMIGPSPIRRTTKYLEAGKIVFREAVKIFSINFNSKDKHHEGARSFVFWHLPQVQYKNPKVQCVTLRDLTPTPFIRIYLEDTKSVIIDLDSREKEEILDHLINFTAICKTAEEIKLEEKATERKTNPSVFGFGCERHCICEVLGQVPCPRLVALPNAWRGKIVGLQRKFKIPPCYMEVGLENFQKED